MHAFILGFVEQRADPAVIALHAAQRAQVLQRTADHAGHAGDRFQHHGTVAVAPGEKGIGEKAHELDQGIGQTVAQDPRCIMLRCRKPGGHGAT